MAIDFKLLLMRRIVHQRIQSLVDDNYHLVFKSTLQSEEFYKLHHRTNGTTITVRAYYAKNRLVQFTGGVCVHDNVIWKGSQNGASTSIG